jgi:putative sulfotransferase
LGAPFELHQFKWRPRPLPNSDDEWGFSAARNEAMRHLGTTHWSWFDSDDLVIVVVDGKETIATAEATAQAFRKMVADSPDADLWFLDYLYRFDDQGRPVSIVSKERLLRNDVGWRWRYPIHEAVLPTGDPTPTLKAVRMRDIAVSHRNSDIKSSVERNAPMIRAWLRQLEKNRGPQADLAHARFLYGRALFATGRYGQAANWMLGRYLGRHPEVSAEEKWDAWMYAAKSMLLDADPEGARQAVLQAIGLGPRFAESYVLLASLKHDAREAPRDVLKILEIAESCMGEDHGGLERHPSALLFDAAVIGAECQFALARYQEALALAERAITARPADERARKVWKEAAEKASSQIPSTAALEGGRSPRAHPNGSGPDPVFVVSTGRCGSTLVSNMLRLHPDVLSLSEFLIMLSPGAFPSREAMHGPQFWAHLSTPRKRMTLMYRHGIAFDEVLYRPGPGKRFTVDTGVPPILLTALPHLTDQPEDLYDEIERFVVAQGAYSAAEHYLRLFDWLRQRFEKKVWVERSGSILGHFEEMSANFPNARFVHLFRDGRDCAMSMVNHTAFRLSAITGEMVKYIGFDPYNLDRVPQSEVPAHLQALMPESFDVNAFWAYDVPPALMGGSWSATEANTMSLLAKRQPGTVMQLRYESLVESPEAELTRLLNFIGLDDPTPEFLHQASSLVRKVPSRWPNLPVAQKAELEKATRFSMGLLYGQVALEPDPEPVEVGST